MNATTFELNRASHKMMPPAPSPIRNRRLYDPSEHAGSSSTAGLSMIEAAKRSAASSSTDDSIANAAPCSAGRYQPPSAAGGGAAPGEPGPKQNSASKLVASLFDSCKNGLDLERNAHARAQGGSSAAASRTSEIGGVDAVPGNRCRRGSYACIADAGARRDAAEETAERRARAADDLVNDEQAFRRFKEALRTSRDGGVTALGARGALDRLVDERAEAQAEALRMARAEAAARAAAAASDDNYSGVKASPRKENHFWSGKLGGMLPLPPLAGFASLAAQNVGEHLSREMSDMKRGGEEGKSTIPHKNQRTARGA